MTKKDLSLNVGINLDETQFLNSYESMLSKASSETQTRVQGAIESFKGPASKDWDKLPFMTMHNAASGQRSAARTFVASMAEDLRLQHVSSKSADYQNALMGAAYRAAEADPMKRYHRMLAEGNYEAADANYPTTQLSKAIESNYALMEQDWSRDFIKKRKNKGLDAADLGKLNKADLLVKADMFGLNLPKKTKKADLINAIVTASQKPSTFIDFAGMRQYAVEHGAGKWINPAEGNKAENFELISKSLDGIEKKSEKTRAQFVGWSEALKSTLGTLTAIGAVTLTVAAATAKAAVSATKAAENRTKEAGANVDKRRAFISMSAQDVLETQTAGQAIGLGKDAVFDEILNMSQNVQAYKLSGGWDALPASLLDVLPTLLDADNPYKAYKSALQSIYTDLQRQNPEEQSRTLMLLDKAGLGNAAALIGQFLSNPEFAQQYQGDTSKLFTLTDNPYYSVYEKAELLTPQIAKLNASLKTSYAQMATDWQEAFGTPFKTWWDDVMKTKVVPWFEKILQFLTRSEDAKTADAAAAQIESNLVLGGMSERNKAIEDNSGRLYIAPQRTRGGLGVKAWTEWSQGDMNYQGEAATAQWNLWRRISKTTPGELSGLDETTKRGAQAVQSRVKYMMERLEDTGLSSFLTNNKKEDMDMYLNRAIQRGAYDVSPNWQETFDAYIEKILATGVEKSAADEEMLEVLRMIADNTGANKELTLNADFWWVMESTFGKNFTDMARDMVNNNANRN